MNPRPTSATIIGWLFIAVSCLMIFSGLMAAVASSAFPSDFREQAAEISRDEPWAFRLMFSMFDYFNYLLAIQFAVATAGIAGGIGLLKLRRWARVLTETLTWIGLADVVLFSGLWLASVSAMGSGEAPEEARLFFVFMLVMGLVVSLTFIVPFVVVLVALRGRKIREAVRQAVASDVA